MARELVKQEIGSFEQSCDCAWSLAHLVIIFKVFPQSPYFSVSQVDVLWHFDPHKIDST
jgi:hypothetical protein